MSVSGLIHQKSYEKVEYILHRHPFTFLPQILFFILLAIVPFVIYFLLNTIFPELFLRQTIYVIGVLVGSVYYLGILMFFYERFVVFYLDMWIVTNDRIVDIEQLGLFSRSISEIDLFRIQDATSDVKGFFATLLNYGTLTVKTASDTNSIIFHDISHPNKVREHLIHLSHIDRKFHTPTIAASED